MPDLVLVFLLVSCVSLVFQVLAFCRLAARQAVTPAEAIAAGGYRRTVACRILAALIYVIVAAVQLAGDGSLSGEALIVFASVQLLWQANSLMDIRLRRKLSQGKSRHARG
jgi:hypothetical protein